MTRWSLLTRRGSTPSRRPTADTPRAPGGRGVLFVRPGFPTHFLLLRPGRFSGGLPDARFRSLQRSSYAFVVLDGCHGPLPGDAQQRLRKKGDRGSQQVATAGQSGSRQVENERQAGGDAKPARTATSTPNRQIALSSRELAHTAGEPCRQAGAEGCPPRATAGALCQLPGTV
jgi:hypothetical protein